LDTLFPHDTSPGETIGVSQDGRLLRIETVLGHDKLLLTRLEGEEQISTPYAYRVTMFSEDQEIAPESLIGSKVTIWIRNYESGDAPISGIVRSFSALAADARGWRGYEAEIVPWLWFLTCTTDCRIFQNLSGPKIIETIFNEHGFADYEMGGLIGQYKPLDFCVQYRETALDFISRWMEELGIFYYFRHEANRHVMVLGDHNKAFKPVAEKSAVFGSGSGGDISAWRHSYQFRSGRYAHKDFAFKTPSQDLLTKESSLLKLQRADSLELYDYPGGYTHKDDGQSLTRLRMEELEAGYHSAAGISGCASFFAGGKFTMAKHSLKSEENKDYVLLRVAHHAADDSHISSNAPPPTYQNSFDAVPAETPYRSPSHTSWPTVQGPQTATVVGPPGETIHTDKYGRVKLQFHWDRRSKGDDKSSCWVRVSQNWAGKSWGGAFIPHVGHEVVVSFLEGDPDMPLVTGRVYNAENMQAIGLPADKTQCSIQDHSGNYLTMEGKGGVQDIRVNAVKDMNFTIKNDYNETVRSGNRTIKIETGTHTETIKGDTKITIATGSLTTTVADNTAEYTSKKTTTINSATADVHVNAATYIQLSAGPASAPASQITLDKDGNISIVAKNIKIIGNQTVVISGDLVEAKGGKESKIGVGGQNTVYNTEKVATSGAGITVTAVGEHNISGAVVKIN
jgi:type VI secretion system secreted protein VgrG